MVEYEPPGSEMRREGLLREPSFVRYELYRLLSSIFAVEHLGQICIGAPIDQLGGLVSEFEEDEIERALLSVAIGSRTLLDRAGSTYQPSASPCGELISDLSVASGSTETLTFREACNKVVHSKKVRFDVGDPNQPTKMNPIVYLYGTKSGKDWKATLNLI